MATKKTTKTTTAKAPAAKAAPAKKAAAAKSTKVAKAAKPVVSETADLFECACEEAKPAKKCAAKAPKAKAEKKTRVTFRVRAEVGSKVFLAGCFNNWDPTAKQMEDKKGTGEFTCAMNLAKGKYEYKFVIDGVWCADCECPDWVQNDMGSMNSLKIVD
jgi:1,4-alpha-glucan branching enzyme